MHTLTCGQIAALLMKQYVSSLVAGSQYAICCSHPLLHESVLHFFHDTQHKLPGQVVVNAAVAAHAAGPQTCNSQGLHGLRLDTGPAALFPLLILCSVHMVSVAALSSKRNSNTCCVQTTVLQHQLRVQNNGTRTTIVPKIWALLKQHRSQAAPPAFCWSQRHINH